MKWLENVTPTTGAVMVWVPTRWGTKELGASGPAAQGGLEGRGEG